MNFASPGALNRRALLQAGSAAVALSVLPVRLSAATRQESEARQRTLAIPADPDRVRALAMRAIDAAKSAGAAYADVRITRTITQRVVRLDDVSDSEELAIGVRALVNGGWGFAAAPSWTLDRAAQLGKDATAQAIENARALPRAVDLGTPSAATGSWTMPVRIEPFSVPLEEKWDFARYWSDAVHARYRDAAHADPDPTRYNGTLFPMWFRRQERALATTGGTYVVQTTYATSGGYAMHGDFSKTGPIFPSTMGVLPGDLGMSGQGWEFFLDAKLDEHIPQMMDAADQLRNIQTKPVDVGRYDVVCDAVTMCSLIDATVAQGTELDRALGYEANATGTSYLSPDPLARLGIMALGSPLLTVRANRSMVGGLATVKWDDEGVIPDDFALIRDGVLQDCQTTREQAAWLRPYYQQRGIPVRSHGCAASESALFQTQQRTANIVMEPGRTELGFHEMVANIKRGLAFVNMGGTTDFQQRSGLGGAINHAAYVREITDGKLGAFVTGTGFLFDSTQLWKNLIRIGGPASAETMGVDQLKGEPTHVTAYSVRAVPAALKDIAIIDATKHI